MLIVFPSGRTVASELLRLGFTLKRVEIERFTDVGLYGGSSCLDFLRKVGVFESVSVLNMGFFGTVLEP